jgi:hypothetical protein
MEVALSSTNFLDRTSETLFVHLPSWGDPILPQTWQHSEDEIRARFSWPKEDDNLEDENECVPMIMSDPLMDKEMTSLMMMRGTFDTEDRDLSESSNDFCDSFFTCRDDESLQIRDDDGCDESRCSPEDESSSSESSRLGSSDNCSSMSSHSEDMDYDTEEETLDPVAPVSHPNTFEWSVEPHYKNHRLYFKLRTQGGAYMQLLADEVITSLNAILEDSMDEVQFRVQQMDGQVLLVDSTMIIPIISSILSIHPSVITPQVEEREKPKSLEPNSKSHALNHRIDRKAVRAPILSRRKPKWIPERKQHNRIGSAWRAMSARGKSRSRRPPTPVE